MNLEKMIWDSGSSWVPVKEMHIDETSMVHLENMKQIVVSHDGKYVTTPKWDRLENEVAQELLRLYLINPCKRHSERKIRQYIDDFIQNENGGRMLDMKQMDGIVMIVNNNISILTGGPGTGKTTVLKAAAYVCRRIKYDVDIVFAAPTGKAARRMVEATGENASTLHKKFGIGIGEDKKEGKALEEDILFIDEMSMNGLEVIRIVLAAITEGKKVVFVGDPDQLMSVDPGAVLRDLIVSRVFPTTMLTKTFRQDNQSELFDGIMAIKEGRSDLPNAGSFRSIERIKGMNMSKTLAAAYQRSVNEYGAEQTILLLPYRKKGVCTNVMNGILQEQLNPEKYGFRHTNVKENYTCFFKKGDFVMQMENRNECANGEVGQVIKVSPEGVTVSYVDAVVLYSQQELTQLSLAYSTTIHKSQGSEYKAVIMAILKDHARMLSRNILYTGITRAKEYVELYYDMEALKIALNTQGSNLRKTCLCEKMIDLRTQYRLVYGI